MYAPHLSISTCTSFENVASSSTTFQVCNCSPRCIQLNFLQCLSMSSIYVILAVSNSIYVSGHDLLEAAHDLQKVLLLCRAYKGPTRCRACLCLHGNDSSLSQLAHGNQEYESRPRHTDTLKISPYFKFFKRATYTGQQTQGGCAKGPQQPSQVEHSCMQHLIWQNLTRHQAGCGM